MNTVTRRERGRRVPLVLVVGAIALVVLAVWLVAGRWGGPAPLPAGAPVPWGAAVDGLACRLVIEPEYVIGQAISAVVEVMNVSDRKRWFVPRLDPTMIEYLTMDIVGPQGTLKQGGYAKGYQLYENSFQPIEPGEIKQFEVVDLRTHFRELEPWWCYPERQTNDVPLGRYVARFKFTSPSVPASFPPDKVEMVDGKPVAMAKIPAPDLVADQWTGEIASAPVAFQVKPLAADDLVVHEWGVFTVFNDAKYANLNRKEEWGSLPAFFYRQFPTERIRWVPSAWDKPIVYFYAKPAAMRLNVKVTFAGGAPVVWWPAAADPTNDGGFRTAKDPKKPRPFRSLTWEAWLGERVPANFARGNFGQPAENGWIKVTEFPLAKECWLADVRLPDAAPLTVVGNIDTPPKRLMPGALDRAETERFLYYDGLVPSPDYLRCEKADDGITLVNRAKFDIARLFVVDRRAKDSIGFAVIDAKQPLKASARMHIVPEPIPAKDWPAAGIKEVRQALTDAGLFAAEADSLLKIWRQRLFEAESVTAFHILPPAEYDRMLPLSVLPAPARKPVRVGIALHPHIEAEPGLAARVAKLIRQLDDADFETRSAADRELREIGPLAISLLRAELKKPPSLETTRRIQAVLEHFDASVWLKATP